jgi:hypothetical protein
MLNGNIGIRSLMESRRDEEAEPAASANVGAAHRHGTSLTIGGRKMKRHLRIVSYFSIPTDLAGLMRAWPEFVRGSGYDVDLRSEEEEVQLRYEDGPNDSYVVVSSSGQGLLLQRVVGLSVSEMSAHSDYLMVYRYAEEPIQSSQPTPGS